MHNICRDVKHSLFTSQSVLKFPSKLLLGKDMFTLTFVDLESDTSISILELDMMKVLINIFAFISARYTIKFTEQK